MAILPLDWEQDSLVAASLLENGADDLNWTLAADARIKTAENPTGIGPVAYNGRPKDETGKVDLKEGSPRDALFIFYKADESVRATLEAQDPADVAETIADFLANHGGDVAAMTALAPTVV
ncbi:MULTISPECIES: hypothetical protein [Desulfococcus]|uniref:Uncharacterized protein n=1 Tax=Desulfococcus multivorans DSM 2059 TaxID=1121405 RepID=S7U345_DESML|nr:hypothetical protein [Desulfococcus multivorans]AOY57203.1 uncharacterized protein Dmul_04280 [Desulfococcus multivorans]AQU99673.1 hypothetical protein B2D07_01990 [Desulfococcus multivorans]EPR43405.1 hypothetical protein dsmv_1196 [Desulfococcus multivorans DSM 2059]SKA25696.1 hypothetical protein SAMN02745446_03567 [Desulfococcus multivorans DSM 2059]